jgi:hypothetical protein
MGNTDGSDNSDNVRTAYEQLCISYHAIDDFRAKLLGFLPLVTGGGLILLTGPAGELREDFFAPVGLLGIAVTAGLLAYELFGIKKCHALLKAGRELECKLNLPREQDATMQDEPVPAGQFLRRPKHLLGLVNEPFAAAAIYPAVLAAWTYLAFFEDPQRGRTISLRIFVVGFLLILLYDQSLKHEVFLRKRGRSALSFVRRLLRRPERPRSPREAGEPAEAGPARHPGRAGGAGC